MIMGHLLENVKKLGSDIKFTKIDPKSEIYIYSVIKERSLRE